jgi:hypothetical protein
MKQLWIALLFAAMTLGAHATQRTVLWEGFTNAA